MSKDCTDEALVNLIREFEDINSMVVEHLHMTGYQNISAKYGRLSRHFIESVKLKLEDNEQ